MRALLLTFAAMSACMLLGGCAGMVIETRGFDPQTAARIHNFLEGKKQACTEGVATESRSITATETRRDDPPGQIYRFPQKAESRTRQEITCN